ncbi:MAG: NAD(P)-binding domain-containing protein [Planctomycetota bacterium]
MNSKPIRSTTAKRKNYFATVPPQEILPIVNSRYESSVRGIFVIGDVTGLPLVKVAANQGREVVEKMEQSRLFQSTNDEDKSLDLVIVGGGPAGISAAIECEKRGLRYVILERTSLANTVRTFPLGKKVYAEPQSIKNISELDVDRDLDRDEFLRIVEQTVADRQLKFKEGADVSKIVKKQDRHFEVQTKDGNSFPTRQVLIAIGRQGQPRKLDIPGCDDCKKVTYRLHTKEDYDNEDVLVVGGGNSAIEAALMLKDHNRVTLSYRGEDFFRAKEENRKLLDRAIEAGQINALLKSNIKESREGEVILEVDGELQTIKNDKVIVLIGQLPPVDFLLDTGMELDGIWNRKRIFWSIVGLLVGIFLYFGSKKFVLHPEDANGKIYIDGLMRFASPENYVLWDWLFLKAAPLIGMLTLAAAIIQRLMSGPGKNPPFRVPMAKPILFASLFLFFVGLIGPSVFTLDESAQGKGPYYLDLSLNWFDQKIGVSDIYEATSPDEESSLNLEGGNGFTAGAGKGGRFFSNLSGLYYLFYFSGITLFGLYWAFKANKKIIWRRNLTIILCQWTLWWGIPTFLVVLFGRNAWSPVLLKAINAWPLNMTAFQVNPNAGPGDPEWWYLVGVVGVVWAILLTFVIIPLFTLRFGKIYCSYICSCGALAETVGNGFRHRGPKGDWPRKLEKFGFVILLLATIATIADLVTPKGESSWLFNQYNIWVGTFLAGAMAIGLYPFLGQRIWCRMWCPLAFWMNFWGRWSQFKITPEKGKCIDCNVCNQFCQMGIDIKSRALKGVPITLQDTPCVGWAECVVRCPMEILHLGDAPGPNLVQLQASKN